MKKKFIAVALILIMSFCMFSMTGCSFSANKNPTEETTENDKDDKSSSEDEDNTEEIGEGGEEGENSETEDEDEEWIPNLELTPTTTESPSSEEKEEKICTCGYLCELDSINESCDICAEDFHKCIGTPVVDPLDEIALQPGVTETVSIIAFGSNFYNDAVMNGTDKSYNYSYIYENIKELLKNYDVKIVTQETVFANNPSDYSGRAPFKSPPSIATALQDAGFNVVASATDHSFDNGKTGILETLNMWKQYQSTVLVTGISASEETRDNLCMVDVNGIRISFLSYTSNLDGMTLTSKDKTYVKTLYDEEDVAEDISYASKMTDFVIVLPHWGTEDSRNYTNNQEEWAKIFIDNGADLIIGTGSDYLQDVVLYENNEGQIIPCYYSLGNFVSPKSNVDEVLSGAAEITISKTGKVTTIEKYNMLPIALHVSKKGDFFKSYMLDQYPADTIKWHNLIANGKDLSLEGMKTQFESTVKIEDLNKFKNDNSNDSNISIIQQPQETQTQENNQNDTQAPSLPNMQITNQ